MNQIPKHHISEREARFAIPPLIKGYIRLGAQIGNGAVIDHDFATVDVCIVLSRAQINARYGRHYQISRGAV
jgi:putative hemolysin